MLNTEDIRNKEVINIYDGKSMGFVCDIEINLKEGRLSEDVRQGNERLRDKVETCKNYWRRCDTGRCPAHNRLDKDHKM